MKNSPLYRIQFTNNGKQYLLYARSVTQGNLFGFIEISDFIFDNNTSLVVDPSEEKLKIEFADVKHSYIPMHNILRIDRVSRPGNVKIIDNGEKIRPFPGPIYTRTPES